MGTKNHSPIGDSISDSLRREVETTPVAATELEQILPFEHIARQVILRRGQLKLTQKQLAERIGTSHSVISRIESGQHSTSVTTLQRLAKALDLKLIIDFEEGEQPENKKQRKVAA